VKKSLLFLAAALALAAVPALAEETAAEPADPAETAAETAPSPDAEATAPAALPETATTPTQKETPMNPTVIVKTSKGDITIRLDPDKAPVTVQNFLDYVDAGFYAGTIFHRVIDGFMIQGGGLDAQLRQKTTRPPIKNEAYNGLRNRRGTIAMARTSVIDSATSQFFINVVDNAFLDFRAPNPQGFGYCVFGEVIDGMDVVDAIKSVPTRPGDVPVETIAILSVERLPAAE
jgi:cyclophilin family peptidyl-prolyl cis-trans isomerase